MKSSILLFLFVSYYFLGTAVAIDCTSPKEVVPNGVCKVVDCDTPDQCSITKDYCAKKGQNVTCRLNGFCACVGAIVQPTKGNCNKSLNGNTHCEKGQVCKPNGQCIKDPTCSFFGDACELPGRKCCSTAVSDDDQLYCHKRKGNTTSTCVRFASVGDSCAGGIPCENESVCLSSKVCSKKPNGSCDDNENECPPGTSCKHVAPAFGSGKACY